MTKTDHRAKGKLGGIRNQVTIAPNGRTEDSTVRMNTFSDKKGACHSEQWYIVYEYSVVVECSHAPRHFI